MLICFLFQLSFTACVIFGLNDIRKSLHSQREYTLRNLNRSNSDERNYNSIPIVTPHKAKMNDLSLNLAQIPNKESENTSSSILNISNDESVIEKRLLSIAENILKGIKLERFYDRLNQSGIFIDLNVSIIVHINPFATN